MDGVIGGMRIDIFMTIFKILVEGNILWIGKLRGGGLVEIAQQELLKEAHLKYLYGYPPVL